MSGYCKDCGYTACDCPPNPEGKHLKATKPNNKIKNIKNTVLIADILQLAGWVILFLLSWKVGCAVFLIAIGRFVKESLWQRYVESTIEKTLEALENLIFGNKETESKEEKQNINN